MRLYGIALKELFWKSKDTKWIVVLTAIVIVMVSVIYAVGEQIAYSYEHMIDNAMPYDCSLYDLSEDEVNYYANKEIYEGSVGYLSTGISTISAWPTDGVLSFGVNPLDGDWQDTTGVRLLEGTLPQADWDIALESSAKKYLYDGCKIGDKVKLCFFSDNNEKIEQEFNVVGFLEAISGDSTNLNAVTTLRTGKLLGAKLLSEDNYKNIKYNIYFKAKNEDDDVVFTMFDSIRNTGIEDHFLTNERRFRAKEEQMNTKGTSNVFRGMAFFIAIISFAMLYNMIHISLYERVNKLGILKCLGIDGIQIGKLFAYCVFLYLLLGMVIGSVGYTFFEHAFGGWILSQFTNGFDSGETLMIFRMDYGAFAIGALLVTGIFILVYGMLALKVCGLSPVEAARFKEVSRTKKIRQKKTKKNQTLVSYLGQRNLGRNKVRSLYTGFTLGITSLLFIVIFNVFCNTDLIGNNLALKKAEEFDLEFSGEGQGSFVDQTFVQQLLDNPCIDNLAWGRRMPEGYFTQDKEIIVEIRTYSDELFDNLLKINGLSSKKYLNSPSVFCLEGENIPKEESIRLINEEEVRYVSIDGYLKTDYYSSYMIPNGIILVMNERATKELLGEKYGYNFILVKTDQPQEVESVIAEKLKLQGIQMYCGELGNFVDRARKELKGLVVIVSYILFCIGFMTIVNLVCNIDINIRLRNREYGIMSALGLEENRIVQLIIYEMTQNAQVTLMVTMILALVISLNMILQINDNISYIKLICTTLTSTGGIYGVVYAVSYFLGKWRYRNNTAPMLHEE